MYKKVLLAYDGSIEGRRALREGAKLAQLCRADVFLLAVVELPSIMAPEVGLTSPSILIFSHHNRHQNQAGLAMPFIAPPFRSARPSPAHPRREQAPILPDT
jgi:nucleotide-binding universal stress UspA family protein